MKQNSDTSQTSIIYDTINLKDNNETLCNLLSEDYDSEAEKLYINDNNKDFKSYECDKEKDKETYSEEYIPLNKDISENKELNSYVVKKERKHWVDALRVFSNFLVIVVHSSSYGISEIPIFSKQWMSLMFWDSFGRVSVPLFIIISGILFLDIQKDISISKLYKKYIFRIVKDILFWNLFYATIGKYFIEGVGFSWENFLKEFFFEMICGKFHIWYLYMCTGLYIVTPIMRIIVKSTETLIYFLVVAFGFCQVIPFIFTIFKAYYPNYIIEYMDEAYGQVMLLMVAGYVIYYPLGYSLNLFEIKNRFSLLIIYIVGFASSLMTFYLKISASKKNEKEFYDFADYNSLNVSIATISTAIFFKYTGNRILKIIFRITKVRKIIHILSNLSYGIYLIHIAYFELFYSLGFRSYTFNPIFFTPIHAFCVWICSAITIYIIKKIPILKTFV